MKTYVGPNGRVYRRKRHPGRSIAMTIVAVTVIGAAIVGLPLIASVFGLIGL